MPTNRFTLWREGRKYRPAKLMRGTFYALVNHRDTWTGVQMALVVFDGCRTLERVAVSRLMFKGK